MTIFLSIHLPFFSSRISHRHVVPFSRDGTPEFAFIACHQSHAPLMLTTHLSPFPLLLRRRFLLTPGGSSLSSSSQQRLRHIYQRRPGPINLPWKKEKGGKDALSFFRLFSASLHASSLIFALSPSRRGIRANRPG